MTWRILYRLDTDAVVIVEVFAKKTAATPATSCRRDELVFEFTIV